MVIVNRARGKWIWVSVHVWLPGECEWFTQPQPHPQGSRIFPKTVSFFQGIIYLLTSMFSLQITDFGVWELSNTHKIQFLFNCNPPKTKFWVPTHVLGTADTIHCRWTFRVFSVCDFQSDWGLITATMLLLIPSDPLPPSFLIRFLWLGYLSSPALTVSDAWLMGLAFKSAGLMRQNPNKGCHSCGGSSFRVA